MPPLKKSFQSEWFSRLVDALLPVFATLAALLVGAVMLLFLKVNPLGMAPSVHPTRLQRHWSKPHRCCWWHWASASPFAGM